MPGPVSRVLDAATLRAFWRAFGPGSPLPRGLTDETLDEVLDAQGPLPGPLTSALATLDTLVTPAGQRALRDACADVGIRCPPEGESANELAARLLLDRTPAAARALARARVALVRRAELADAYELLADGVASRVTQRAGDVTTASALRAAMTARGAKKLSARVGAILVAAGLPADCDVSLAETDQGITLHIDRGEAPEVEQLREGGRLVRRRLVRATRDRIEIADGGDRITLRATQAILVAPYARLMGELLHGDEAAFGRAPTFSLRVLSEEGRAALSAPSLAAEIAEIRVVALAWDSGERETFVLDGVDCLVAIARDGLRLAGRTVTRATLRIVTTDGRRLTVTIRPPWRIARDEDAPEDLVRRVLSALGNERPADEPRDLWTLDPWIHPMSVLATLFGKTADQLRHETIVRAHQSRAVSDPAFALEGRVLVAMPLPGEPGVFYGVSEVAHVPSRTLQPEELTLAALDLVALGKHVASALSLSGTVRELRAEPGIVDLGVRRAGGATARVLLVARDPGAAANDVGDRLRARFPGELLVALVPPGRQARLGALDLPFDPRGWEPEALAAAIDGRLRPATREPAPSAVPSVPRAPTAPSAPSAPSARLVLDARTQQATLDGVRLTRLLDRHVRFLLLLAQSPRPLSGKEIDGALSPKTQEGAARKTKHTLTAAVVESFRASRRKPPPDVDDLVARDGASGYRLGIEAVIVGDDG